jgi:hypothetical protein
MLSNAKQLRLSLRINSLRNLIIIFLSCSCSFEMTEKGAALVMIVSKTF